MEYEVLSPLGQVSATSQMGLQPRVNNLKGKTIGMYAHFKEQAPLILKEIEQQLKEKFPTTKFTYFQYLKDTAEIVNDPEYKASFEKWLSNVDTVISGYGDAGSCAMFLAYNTSAIEKLGKPAVMIVNKELLGPARKGASVRNIPKLRFVSTSIEDMSFIPSLDSVVEKIIRPEIMKVIDEIIAALTNPLTIEESTPVNKVKDTNRIVFKGNLQEVNEFFYKSGWVYGMPIIPPTEESVREMLTGTDLPPDHVVARIPPMLGEATVEKIAVNAVMAGCLPTYLPVLIAAVQGLVDSKIHLEGWTCSIWSWAPLIIINGPLRRDLHINSGATLMSPYYKANAAIAHALGMIIMNISGVRPTIEDMSIMGHEARFGMCIAECEEASPWEPLHVDYGLSKEDSAVTLFWPTERVGIVGRDATSMLNGICRMPIDEIDFDPGCAFILTPECAKAFSDEGWKKKTVISYIMEYARRPAAEVNTRWLKSNNHLPKEVPLPVNTSHSTRRFFSSEHLLIIVAGGRPGVVCQAYGGGGGHGGPVTKKIELPAAWSTLVNKYKDIVPTYIQY
jgi:hypothetical protein